MGVGEPDWMAEPEVIEVLYNEAKKWENRGYTDNGIGEFKEAADRKSTRLNSSHLKLSRMPSSA